MDLSRLVAVDELYPALERITESNRYGLGEIMAAVYRGGHNVRTIHEALLLSRLFQYAWEDPNVDDLMALIFSVDSGSHYSEEYKAEKYLVDSLLTWARVLIQWHGEQRTVQSSYPEIEWSYLSRELQRLKLMGPQDLKQTSANWWGRVMHNFANEMLKEENYEDYLNLLLRDLVLGDFDNLFLYIRGTLAAPMDGGPGEKTARYHRLSGYLGIPHDDRITLNTFIGEFMGTQGMNEAILSHGGSFTKDNLLKLAHMSQEYNLEWALAAFEW